MFRLLVIVYDEIAAVFHEFRLLNCITVCSRQGGLKVLDHSAVAQKTNAKIDGN